MNIFDCLKENETFTDSERILADYIIKNVESVVYMSIYELSEQTNCSTSTIIRLCKKCQLKGFKDFKVVLTRDYNAYINRAQRIDANLPFNERDTDLMISSKIAKLTSETIEETQSYLTSLKLNRCIDLILSSRRLVGIGVSDCFLRLKDFQLKLLRIDYFIELIDLQPEQFYLADSSKKEGVAIIISYSGRTAEIINDAKLLSQNHTPIIAITSDEKSPLATFATEILLLPKIETSSNKVSNFSSQLAIEYLLNTLYSCLYSRNYRENMEKKANTPVSQFIF